MSSSGKSTAQKRRKAQKSRSREVKELIIKDGDDQEYGQVTTLLGGCRFLVKCNDQKTRNCHVRGKLQGRDFIKKDDWVLIGLRGFEDGKADIIQKYSNDEVRQLKKQGELSSTATEAKDEESKTDANEIPFDFEEI